MNRDNNKFIATVIKGSHSIHNINKRVAFEVNGKIYIKKIKEKKRFVGKNMLNQKVLTLSVMI